MSPSKSFEKMYFRDIYGRRHKLYTVRSIGPGSGFMVFNILRNLRISDRFATRKAAREWMQKEVQHG